MVLNSLDFKKPETFQFREMLLFNLKTAIYNQDLFRIK